MFTIAAEHAESILSLSALLELGVILSTIGLTIVSLGLWKATADVHRDEINKMTDALSHDNDNMADVAIAAIDSHAAARQRMREVSRARRTRH